MAILMVDSNSVNNPHVYSDFAGFPVGPLLYPKLGEIPMKSPGKPAQFLAFRWSTWSRLLTSDGRLEMYWRLKHSVKISICGSIYGYWQISVWSMIDI